MSGGSLDYACYNVENIAKSVKSKIENKELEEAILQEANPHQFIQIREEMKSLYKDLKKNSKRLHALEWFIAGDTGVESYLEELKSIKR